MMKDFEIFTDSCCDLPIEYVRENNIRFARISCSYNGENYYDDLGQTLTHKKFFEDLRNGAMPLSSQPSVDEFFSNFKAIIEAGRDIIYICVSTGLSGTENSARVARDMILEEYNDAKIEIVNTLTASIGQGLLVMKAVEMKKQGKTLEDIKEYIIDIRPYFNTYMTVDDLHHLKRGGRLSTAMALIGIVLHVKPILTLNKEGKVSVIGKVRGRKASISKLASIVCERIENPEEQIIGISHGDSLEDALKLKEEILSNVKVKDILVNYNGPGVATHGGPGNLAVFFIGKEKQNHII